MYFDGTNFGRTAGGPAQITSYDYDALLDEYGLLRKPKWSHLKDLHAAIKLCEPALVAADSPQYIKLGPKQEAHVYRGASSNNGQDMSLNEVICAAFIANIDEHESEIVKFSSRGEDYPSPYKQITSPFPNQCGTFTHSNTPLTPRPNWHWRVDREPKTGMDLTLIPCYRNGPWV
ncbi:hypothetical protein FXO37_02807 [Capsicum annuum]|nr:hypothetical protein FXO37_02807 [Capsicum annuum]